MAPPDDDGSDATQKRPALKSRGDFGSEKTDARPWDSEPSMPKPSAPGRAAPRRVTNPGEQMTPPMGVEPATRKMSAEEFRDVPEPDDRNPGAFDPTAVRKGTPGVDDRDPGAFDPTSVRRSAPEVDDRDPGAFAPTAARSGGRVPDAVPFEATSVRSITSDSDPLIGAMLGEYRVLAPLGSGGMGVVYRGVQPVIDRPVAIKVMRREFAQDPAHVRRFLQEARLVSVARHPGIVDVFSFGETPGGQPYLVMELLEGEALDALLQRRGALPAKEAITLLVPMLNALSAAHAAGVIHRDLKPANVFIVKLQDGTTFPKLLDFGLAKRGDGGAAWVRQTSVGGTPLYLAPEQARGEDLSPRTDLYSLGCVAYEMLTGTPPFTAVNLSELLDHHQTLAPRPLRPRVQVPPELERLVLALLEKDPARRPASSLAVREELERIGQKLAVGAEPQPRRKPPQVRRVERTEETPALRVAASTAVETPVLRDRRPVWPFIVGGLLLVVLGAGLAIALGPKPPPPPPPVEPRRAPPTPVPVPPPPVELEPVKPEPVVEPEPQPEPVDVAPPEPTKVKSPRHSSADALKRLKQIERRVQQLPDESVRRAAREVLEELSLSCSSKPDACWRELDQLERDLLR